MADELLDASSADIEHSEKINPFDVAEAAILSFDAWKA
jgi:hypothetical protein